MTTRHAGYIVVLEDDIRSDDAEAVVAALHMIRGVVSVEPIPADPALHIARARADHEWRARIAQLLGENSTAR